MPTTRHLRIKPSPTIAAMIRRCGRWATARHCRNLGIEFDDAYLMIFGRLPRYRRGNGCRRPAVY